MSQKLQLATFCCENSALIAAKNLNDKISESVKVFPVPCGGLVEHAHILRAFDKGADGVMVMTCVSENCKHHQGKERADKRTAYVQDVLKSIGLNPQRLASIPVAANDEARFIKETTDMLDKISVLGPLEGKVK